MRKIDRIFDVTGGQGGDAFLILGEEKTALMDCGMAYCADKLIGNIKQILDRRALDYIFISHSHYDHIGAIPYLREEWPEIKVLGAEYAQRILGKDSALQTIRALGVQAAELYSADKPQEYDSAMLKVDRAVMDGDIINLGGLVVRVIETKGHTKCSLSFLINNETLFASESTGYMSKSGRVYPGFITSCEEAIRSINLCKAINPRFIFSPHYGLVNEKDTPDYWEKCLLAVKEARDFILFLSRQGHDEEQILIQYEMVFRDEQSRQEQPYNAFKLNTQSMIKTVLKEQHPPLPLAQ